MTVKELHRVLQNHLHREKVYLQVGNNLHELHMVSLFHTGSEEPALVLAAKMQDSPQEDNLDIFEALLRDRPENRG